MKRQISRVILLLLTLCFVGGCQSTIANEQKAPEEAKISFVDDDGRQIVLDAPCEKIISLYSAHTENLYFLGVGEKIIGVHNTSIYPPDAAFKPIFAYDADPEKVIAAEPDLVLIRPFITGKAPDFVKALENAGITVVSLYPERLADFDDYIMKLALLTGTETVAQEKLAQFHQSIDEITAKCSNVETKQKVFFETTEVDLRTTTANSMAGQAIVLAGGENVAADVKPIKEGSSIAAFGIENVLALADEIDVYLSQRGAMNAGGSEHSIKIRPGFDTIKAVQEDKVYLINEKIISSPTFRYDKGVRELARYMYPELMDDLSGYSRERLATRADWANLIVKSLHLPIYVTSSSKYYQQSNDGHIYGLFADVPWTDENFDAIETVVQAGYVPYTTKDGAQFFFPEENLTREELAKSIFLIGDFEHQEQKTMIDDLTECASPKIIQSLVDNGVLTLNNGAFEPKRQVTVGEIIDALAFV